MTLGKQEVEVTLMTKQNQLKLTTETYEEALIYVQNYEDNIIECYQIYQVVQHKQKTMSSMEELVERLQIEIEEFEQIVRELLLKIEKYKKLLAENHKQQQLLNVEEVQRELSETKSELIKSKSSSDQLLNDIHEADKQLLLLENMLNESKKQGLDMELVEKNWYNMFLKEANRFQLFEGALETYAKEIQRKADLNRLTNLEDRLIQQYNHLISDNLGNYNPKLSSLSILELSSDDEDRLGELVSYNQLKNPQFKLENEQFGVYELLQKLKDQCLGLEELLKHDEEELFKHFILESVGNILRSRIQQGMKWVESMNQLLKDQENSSGLNLSIRWKPVTKASENELGTLRLVELLQKPVEILSESDKKDIAQHFQEKVKMAQEQVRDNEEGDSILFQAITKVLDYRDWFEFELKFKKGNEGNVWQVLSDRKFNQFSGGEKATAMYLPLFIAVYSRYSDAEDFCPKVITLDEAFAGIDEKNIAELFKACEQLGFNYVMNSQALFGAYSTVSSLSIYELLRPQNTNIVTPIKYQWDGYKKVLVIEES